MSDKLPPKEAGEYCNGRKTDGSGYCKHEAGWGTDHPGIGRCKFHGGASPNHEKSILDELENAAEDASIAIKLRLKHIRRKAEESDFEDVDWSEVDRLARTVFDRTGRGPSQTKELTTGEGDFEFNVNFTKTDDG